MKWNHCRTSFHPHCTEVILTQWFLPESPGQSKLKSGIHSPWEPSQITFSSQTRRSHPASPVLPVGNTEMTLLLYRRMLRAMHKESRPCGDEFTAVPRGVWGFQAAAAPSRQPVASQTCSQACGHCRIPSGFYQLWLTSLASGSCLFMYKVHVRSSLPGKTGQLISSLKAAI